MSGNSELRRRAERRVAASPEIVPKKASDLRRLVHELRVHQIELEMQNEDLRQTEEALRKSQRLLSIALDSTTAAKTEAAQAAQTQLRFFAAASHDLRQPFQAMRLFFEVLNQSAADHQRPALGLLGKSIKSAEDLLGELLEMSRLRSGQIQVVPAATKIDEVIAEVVADLSLVADNKGVALKAFMPAVEASIDRSALRRMCFNLVANALKFTKDGGVLVGIRRRAGNAVVEVWDTGIGVEPDKAAHIFDEFYQIDNPARDASKGIGLGLAIINHLCKQTGCQVSFASRVGRGSVFRLVIPAYDNGAGGAG